jgi:hypothetical protein
MNKDNICEYDAIRWRMKEFLSWCYEGEETKMRGVTSVL